MDLDIKTLQNQYWKQLTEELLENYPDSNLKKQTEMHITCH